MTKLRKQSGREIIIPILNNEYKVIVCFGNEKFIKKVLHSWGHKPADMLLDMERRRGLCYYTKGCHPVIALPRFPKTAEEIGSLAHEAVHAVGYIFQAIEQNSAEEVYAHSVGAIVRNTLKVKYKDI